MSEYVATLAVDSISHDGVKGMHWGEWNEETRRKYLGGMRAGKKVPKKFAEAYGPKPKPKASAKDFADRFRKKLSEKRAEHVKKSAERKAQAQKEREKQEKERKDQEEKAKADSENEEMAKSRGYESYAAYQKARKDALTSYDPKVIQKGLATLSDNELRGIINRLELNDRINSRVKPEKKPESFRQKAVNAVKKNLPKYVTAAAKQAVRQELLGKGLEKIGVNPETAKSINTLAKGTIELAGGYKGSNSGNQNPSNNNSKNNSPKGNKVSSVMKIVDDMSKISGSSNSNKKTENSSNTKIDPSEAFSKAVANSNSNAEQARKASNAMTELSSRAVNSAIDSVGSRKIETGDLSLNYSRGQSLVGRIFGHGMKKKK